MGHVSRDSRRARWLAVIFGVAILAGVTPAIAGETSLRMSSEPGDYIGVGQEYFYDQTAGTFVAQATAGHSVSVSFHTPDSQHFWSLNFAASGALALAPGLYTGALRFPFQGSGHPGLSVWGDGRGCNELTGAFEVKQITVDASGSVRSFWAVFEQHCENEEPALTGDIRYAADVVVGVNAPFWRRAPRGRPLTVDVSATEVNGHRVSLAADGLPSGATFVDHGDNTGTFAWTPPLDAPLGQVTVRFRGDNGIGQTDSATTLIDVRGVTRLEMRSDPGDYVGHGQTYHYDETAGTFQITSNFDNEVSVSFHNGDWSAWWHLDFAAPDSAPLEVRGYPRATRYPFQAPGEAGLDVTGWAGCNTLTGSFVVKQLSKRPDGTIGRFWATFEQHCEGATAALRGDVMYNADVQILGEVPPGLPTASYFPLEDGDSWTYNALGGGTTVVVVLAGTVPINSAPTKVLQSSGGAQNFYTNDSLGIRQHRIVDLDLPVGGGATAAATWTFTPPVVLAPGNAMLGDAVQSGGSALLQVLGSTYPLNYAATSTMEGLETVSVPLGTFVAAKIVATVSMWGTIQGEAVSETVTQTVWLASHIGIVKLEEEGRTLVLAATNVPAPSTALAAAVLPSSRSVQSGRIATAFATIMAAGTGTATGCRIAPLRYLPGATFLYQKTEPETNRVSGLPSTPVDIPAGKLQTFLLAIAPTQEFSPTEVEFAFYCTNTGPAPVLRGVSTLLLSASDAPVPDVVALAATLNNDGIVDIFGPGGTGVFAVATANVGAGGPITASGDTGSANLPVRIFLCQTDPSTGECISAIGRDVTTQIDAGATPTFGVFVNGTDTVPFDPATNRIFVRFKDPDGITRGSTSVAVRTQ